MKLGIFASHPIQYQVPLWRMLAEHLEVKVFYYSDISCRGGLDPGFGIPVKWDIPLLEGYASTFIRPGSDLSNPAGMKIPHLKQIFRSEAFDWVLINGYTHGFERQLVRQARHFDVRVMIRGELTDSRPQPLYLKDYLRDQYLLRFYRRIAAFCYIGQEARMHLKRMKIPEEKLFFSPYCVDDRHFSMQADGLDKEACRRKLGISQDTTCLLFSGKLIPRKNPEILTRAAEVLSERRNIALILLGEGPLRADLESRFRPTLGDRLIMPGFVNQTGIGEYFKAADVFILPSRFETWGLVVNEAMIFALPAVVSDRVGCRWDLVLPGKTGYVFQDDQVASLVDALDRLAGDRSLTRKMGIQAGEHVRKYSTGNSVDGILRALSIE